MIDVQPGQTVIVERRGHFRAARADKVTPKQIRTLRGFGYDVEDRYAVIYAGPKEQAERLLEKLDELQNARQREKSASRRLFEEEIAPAQERRNERDNETTALYRKGVLALLAKAENANV